MPAIVTIKADNKIYLKVINGSVQAFETVHNAIDYYEIGYNKNHGRGYEASMSAVLNAITYQAAIHPWDHEDLQPLVDSGIIDVDNFRSYRMSHVSGFVDGALFTGNGAEEFHEKGIKPRLIS